MNREIRHDRHQGRPRQTLAVAKWLLVTAIFALPLTALRTPAALNAYLDLTGIDGESTAAGYKNKIDVLAWSWGMSQSGTFHAGSGGTAGSANFQDLSVTKWIDKSSTKLMLHCANGGSISKGTLTLTETIAAQNQPVLTITFDRLLVSSLSLGGSASEDRLTENLTLNFSNIKQQVHLFDTSGSDSGETFVEWDLLTDTGSGGGDGTGNSFPGDIPPIDPPPTNTPPTITAIAPLTIAEDSSATVTFTVADAETAAGALVISRGTNNPAVIPVSGIGVTGGGGTKTAVIIPARNATGVADVTLSVRDTGNLSTSTTFTVTVTPVNDPPAIQVDSLGGGPPPADPTNPGPLVSVNGEPVIFEILLIDPDNPPETLLLAASSSNPEVLDDFSIEFLGDGPARTVQMIPRPGAVGTTTVTITAREPEGEISPPMVFELTVTSNPNPETQIVVNGLPSFELIRVPENSPPLFEIGFVEVLSDPPMPFTLQLLDSNNGRFALGGAAGNVLTLSQDASLDFETDHPPSIIIQATDPVGLSWAERFLIEIINVNEPATIDPPHQGRTTPGTPTTLTGLTITDPDIEPGADILLTISTSNGILTIDESGPLAGRVDPNNDSTLNIFAPPDALNTVLDAGGLTFTSEPDFVGTTILTFSTNDNGSSGTGGPQTYTAETFIDVARRPREQWNLDNFTAAQLADPAVGGLLGHADTDPLDNLVEYGTGSDPNNPDEGFEVFQFIDVFENGEFYPAVRFPRRYSDFFLLVTVEQATDLNGWSSGPGFTKTFTAIRVDDEIELATVRSATPKNAGIRQQLRVRFQVPDPDPDP